MSFLPRPALRGERVGGEGLPPQIQNDDTFAVSPPHPKPSASTSPRERVISGTASIAARYARTAASPGTAAKPALWA